jgi:hypothetical protein
MKRQGLVILVLMLMWLLAGFFGWFLGTALSNAWMAPVLDDLSSSPARFRLVVVTVVLFSSLFLFIWSVWKLTPLGLGTSTLRPPLVFVFFAVFMLPGFILGLLGWAFVTWLTW